MKQLLEVRNLRKSFPVQRGLMQRVTAQVEALDGVSFSVAEGECMAVVGESGGGKTTLARCILRLIDVSEGRVIFDGVDLLTLTEKELRRRRKDMQMIFQDPYSSLNPRLSVEQTLLEPLEIHQIVPPSARSRRVRRLLAEVGLPEGSAGRYPHEFSGGQRQRIGIARALASQPRLLVADEPVSALDVSVRAEILNLLTRLRREMGLTVLLIAHDLAIVEQVSDRIIVLYLGRVVETAPTSSLFGAPQHPYSSILMASVPMADPGRQQHRIQVAGEAPGEKEPLSGCRFRSRCPIAQDRCAREQPELTEVGPDHHVACHFPGEDPGTF